MVASTCNFFYSGVGLKHSELKSLELETTNITNKHPVGATLNYRAVMATEKAKQEFSFTDNSEALKNTI